MSKADQVHTVMVKGEPVRSSYLSSAVILTVGMAVQLNSSDLLAASSVATPVYSGGEYIVTEAPERNKGVFSSGTVETTYAASSLVPVIAPYRGCETLVLLTSGQVITSGGLLEVASTGKWIAHAGTNLPAYRARETMSPSQDALIHATRL